MLGLERRKEEKKHNHYFVNYAKPTDTVLCKAHQRRYFEEQNEAKMTTSSLHLLALRWKIGSVQAERFQGITKLVALSKLLFEGQIGSLSVHPSFRSRWLVGRMTELTQVVSYRNYRLKPGKRGK